MTIKKISIVCLCMQLATACQPTGQNNVNEQDSVATDSVVATKDSVVEKEVQKVLPFMSADAALFDVRGEVKKFSFCRTKYDAEGKPDDEYFSEVQWSTFDDDKHIICDSSYNGVKMIRNEKGQLIALKSGSSDDGDEEYYEETYTYNEQGLPSSKTTEDIHQGDTETYIYNEQGDLVSSIYNWSGDLSETVDSSIYEILKKDHCGNWTQRKVTTYRTDIYHATDENLNPIDRKTNSTIWFMDVREIVYR